MRKIKQAKVSFVSLCPVGTAKNRLQTVYKADAPQDQVEVEFRAVTKAAADFEEKGELLAVIYAPGLEDSDGHYAEADVVREMAHSHLQSGAALDIYHDGAAVSKADAYVAESFIIQAGDERFADWRDRDGNAVDVTGGWAQLIRIENESLRKAHRDGEWGDVSLAGTALLEPEEPRVEDTAKAEEDGLFHRLLGRVKKALGLGENSAEELEMKKEELLELLDERDTALIEKLTKALRPEEPEAPEGGDADPEPEGTENPLEARVAELEEALAKALKKPSAPASDTPTPSEDDELVALGKAIAKGE